MTIHYFAHPDRMGVRAALHGLAARSPRDAVVVDLAAGDGLNLLSIAAAYPSARCLGIDRSEAAVARATTLCEQLGLDNVRFVRGDPAASNGLELPSADYLVALGLASSIAPDARRRLFARIGQHLAPGGSALISFTCSPGDSELAALRSLMRFHVKNIDEPRRAVSEARAIARSQVERISKYREDRGAAMKRLGAELDALEDDALYQMLTADEHHPLSMRELARDLTDAGLQWLSNARMDEPRAQQLPGLIRELAQSGDVVRRQAYLDCFLYTRSRTSIVCRSDEAIVREVTADAFRRFHVGGRVSMRVINGYAEVRPPTEALVVESPAGTAVLSQPAARLLRVLAEVVPVASPVDALLARIPEIEPDNALAAVAELWLADVIELALEPPAVASIAPERPVTGRLQRLLAEHANDDGATIGSLWHRDWDLDATEVATLRRMDGTIARDALDRDALRKLAHKGFIASA